MLEKLVTYEIGTHELIIYSDPDPDVFGWLEVRLKPCLYRRLPRRAFTMPCRPVCGLDLTRVRYTCMWCRIRRVHSGKMPAMNELEDIYTLFIMKGRPGWKRVLLKKFLPICEWLATK